MKIEGLYCEVAACKNSFKQGESVIVQVRVLNDDDTVVADLENYVIEVLVSSPRALFAVFGKNTNENVLPLEVDVEGYIAFELDASRTARMEGEYFIEISLRKEDTKLITDVMPLLQIVPSLSEQQAAK